MLTLIRSLSSTKLLILLAVAACNTGCSNSRGPERLAVEGAVMLDGRPLKAGIIRFLPDAGVKGPAATAAINEGFYEIPKELGPVAGRHRIEIEGSVAPAFEIDDEAAYAAAFNKTKGKPLPNQPVPAEYNRRSSLSAELVSTLENNKFDFDLRLKSENSNTHASLQR